MVVTNPVEGESSYDRQSELKALDDTKAGVKGLVDAGVVKIPRIFIHEHHMLHKYSRARHSEFSIPVVDLQGLNQEDASVRSKVIDKVRNACEKWGFFQVVNHGIPMNLLDQMLDGIRRFHEQDAEAKKEFYTRDFVSNKVLYNTNFDLYKSPVAQWRDTLVCVVAPHRPHPPELPAVCGEIIMEYTDKVKKVGDSLFELLSEALGLNSNHLREMGCSEGLYLQGQYYPPCPQPELTLGARDHADTSFLTILQQDQIGGLQILHENQWVDVTPVHGALIVNVGDLLQLISNDKFVSVVHRVVANKVGPRISAACFFRTQRSPENTWRVYGPIKELISEENPPIYGEITVKDLIVHHLNETLTKFHGISSLEYFKL